MQKLLAQIEKCLTTEAWNGARLDEASKLVVEYCYRAQKPTPIDLVVRGVDDKPIKVKHVAFEPSVGRVFILAQRTILILTDDLVSIATIKISFDAVAIAFDPIRRRLLVLRSDSVGWPHRSVVSIDNASSGTGTFSDRELGVSRYRTQDDEMHVDSTNGDLYVLCTRAGRYLLSRVSPTGDIVQKSGSEYADWNLCHHDGVGALLVHSQSPIVRMNRDLMPIAPWGLVFNSFPRFVSWTRDLVIADHEMATCLLLNDLSGKTHRIVMTPFIPRPIPIFTNGVLFCFCFHVEDATTIHIAEPCPFEIAHPMSIRCA